MFLTASGKVNLYKISFILLTTSPELSQDAATCGTHCGQYLIWHNYKSKDLPSTEGNKTGNMRV